MLEFTQICIYGDPLLQRQACLGNRIHQQNAEGMIQNGLEESSNLLIAIEAAQINQNEELISGTSE